MSLVNIQHEYKDDYSALGIKEREELVREYKETSTALSTFHAHPRVAMFKIF